MKLKFPYGNCNFEQIVMENFFYQDRSDRIRDLEEVGHNLLLLRPRRFGKSLLLSMLENYYDVAKADKFERLFGHLAIGKNPTPYHNQYFVMKWDFSMVDPHGDIEAIVQSLYSHINDCIADFANYYQSYLKREIRIDDADALSSFRSSLTAVKTTPHRLYLMIDEYDNFANEVMVSRKRGQDRYEQLLEGEGILKTLFKVIKGTLAGMGLERVFMTGVSPVVMSDLTSGHNIARNIYFKPEFNDLCGFHEAEIEQMLQQVVNHCGLSAAQATEAMQIMKIYYNGYCFVPPDTVESVPATKMYNPTMVLYFLDELQNYCRYPANMLDNNLSTDRQKLEYAAFLPGGGNVIVRAVDEKEPLAIPNLTSRFGVREMLEAENDDTFVASLLYYLGMLTINGRDPWGQLLLKVPNLTANGLYFERLQKILLPQSNKNEIERAVRGFYATGNLLPVCELVEQRFKALDNRDYRQADELLVKTAFLAILFNDLYYMIDSETELQRSYADLTMILRPDMRQYQLLDHVVEFKYVTLKDAGLSGVQVREMSREDLAALPAVEAQLTQAKAQIVRYRDGLAQIYGNILRLHAHVVVSVGFEKAVWLEL